MTNMFSMCIFFILSLSQCINGNVLETRLDGLQSHVESLQNERNQLQQQLSLLQLKVDSREKRSNLDKSAFTVALSAETIVSDDTVVVFDNVITDNMNDYNPTFGFFECTTPGLYLFTITVSSPPGEASTLVLRHLGGSLPEPILVSSYMADATDQSGAHTGTVIIELGAGDTVSVVAQGTVNLSGGSTTIFSGYFI